LFQDIAICFASEPLLEEVRGTARTVNKAQGRYRLCLLVNFGRKSLGRRPAEGPPEPV
jgi:hypothetical protein